MSRSDRLYGEVLSSRSRGAVQTTCLHLSVTQTSPPHARESAACAALDIFPHGNIIVTMPRAATTSDVFNAIAEPRRRDILEYLLGGERPVGDIVAAVGLTQPSVSKHLRVLRDVGLVDLRPDGRRVFYRANPNGIRTVHEWATQFERHWKRQLTRIKERAERN